MDAFALPLALFAGGLGWLLVEMIRGSFDDPYPLQAGVTWAVTCPIAGVLFGIGLAPLAFVVGTISVLALGSLGYWFLANASDDAEDDSREPVAPDPPPTDDNTVELPAWALRAEPKPEPKPKSDFDWDGFDDLREKWEKEIPLPVADPERERISAVKETPVTDPERERISVEKP
jgi:hypothetical protein